MGLFEQSYCSREACSVSIDRHCGPGGLTVCIEMANTISRFADFVRYWLDCNSHNG